MNLENKTVLVAGSGISGIGATALLNKVGANVILYDGKETLKEEDIRVRLGDNRVSSIVIGNLPTEIIHKLDLMILSPGISVEAPFVIDVKEAGVPVWGEIELAYHFDKGRIAAITGTNGKTTTTALVGEIMSNYYKNVLVVGNIGTPYTSVVTDSEDDGVTVAEISSFQLETIDSFKPEVSAILNITPDHLDRHKTMENYAAVKMNIAKNQNEDDVCVLNFENPVLRKFGETLCTRVIYFSSAHTLERGVYLDGEEIIYSSGDYAVLVCKTTEMNLIGIHNYENVMAAAAIAISLDVPIEIINSTIKQFKAVEHRIEYVTEKTGVVYYNDSKGTNPDASIKAIIAMSKPTVLIAGGYDKNSDFDEWVQAFGDKIKYLVLLGKTRNKIAETARKYGFTNIRMTESLEEAVKVSSTLAGDGEAVLLSPACASWDMFKSYEERGRLFKEYVNRL